MQSRRALAIKARAVARSQFEEGDDERYQSLCGQYQTEHKMKEGFDFFDAAAALPANFAVWTPFVLSLRALGRFNVIGAPSEDKSVFEEKKNKAFKRAMLMGQVITCTICYLVLPIVMREAIPAADECALRCREFLKTIQQMELVDKKKEDAAAMVAAVNAVRAEYPEGSIRHTYVTAPTKDIAIETETIIPVEPVEPA